jgi:cell division protein FtsL
MTTIRPNRDRNIKRVFALCYFGAGGMVLTALFSYMSLVAVKHDLSETRLSLETAKVENAELKNQYFQLTNADSVEKLAGEMGLIQDRNPGWALASRS